MILYGAGGHAKVILDILNASGEFVSAIFDDDPKRKNLQGILVTHSYSNDLFADQLLIIAIGDNATRCRISSQINHQFGNAIHHSALIAPDVVLNTGIVIMHNAVIQAGSKLGNHVIVNTGATVDHDCDIADFAHIAPGAVVCGMVNIGKNTLLGAGCIVIPNIKIGKNCIIGAGSVVTTDIPDHATVCGNPARIIKL